MDARDHEMRTPGPTGVDDSAAVQDELRREESERGEVGDTAADRNLTGSSTWLTLPDTVTDRPSDEPPAGVLR